MGDVIGHMDHYYPSDERRQSRTRQRRRHEDSLYVESGEEEKVARGNQTLIANRRANAVDPPSKTGAMPSLNRSGTHDGTEKQLSSALEHSPLMGSEVGSSAESRR